MKRFILIIIICTSVFNSCKKENNPLTPVSPPGNRPSTPTLSSPENNSYTEFMPVKFEWSADSGSVYTLQVSAHNTFSDFVINHDSIIATSQLVTSLDPLTPYYWRVKATNKNGSSDWSSPVRYLITASAGNTGISCPGIPTISYSGRLYHTVQIGNQCWLKENLDVGIMIAGNQNQTNNSTIEKYCYSNDTTICKIYGGLYSWDEAMQYGTSGTKVQGICPSGWHIPSSNDFYELKTVINNNGNSIKAIGQGSRNQAGTDESGFSGLLSGYRGQLGTFYNIGDYTNYWSSTQSDSTNVEVMWLGFDSKTVNQSNSNKTVGFSVRCIKD
jgi:uncharacterized protein (TIGR02145 family)